MEPTLYYFFAAVLVLLGLAGTVLPVLPGIVLVFAGLLLAAWADGFAHVGVMGLVIIGALGLLAFVADFVASLVGAKRVGASPLALVGAAVGGLVGLFFSIPGMIIGPFVGAVAGEFLAKRRLGQAGKVGLGTWFGLIAAAVLKVVIACLMIATFWAFWLLA
ncbi:MAG TPA: DUF456 domain-containing protein [Usitatibacter sp.]|nr:DUF456 domain-containing protein [Usitatibacter sp.]